MPPPIFVHELQNFCQTSFYQLLEVDRRTKEGLTLREHRPVREKRTRAAISRAQISSLKSDEKSKTEK